MLVIRREQMAALSSNMRTSFEPRVMRHLKKNFPEQCKALGDVQLREFVDYGVQRASDHGFITEADTCKYIDLMFVFGRDFDMDPDLPWAVTILHDPRLFGSRDRMDRLFDAAMEKLEADDASEPVS